MFNYSKLRGKIIEICGNVGQFATLMKWSVVTVSRKLNNKVYWTQDEILTAIDVLSLKISDIPDYFFTREV